MGRVDVCRECRPVIALCAGRSKSIVTMPHLKPSRVKSGAQACDKRGRRFDGSQIREAFRAARQATLPQRFLCGGFCAAFDRAKAADTVCFSIYFDDNNRFDLRSSSFLLGIVRKRPLLSLCASVLDCVRCAHFARNNKMGPLAATAPRADVLSCLWPSGACRSTSTVRRRLPPHCGFHRCAPCPTCGREPAPKPAYGPSL